MIALTIPKLKQLQIAWKQAPEQVDASFRQAIKQSSSLLERSAKRILTRGPLRAADTGRLLQSIQSQLGNNGFRAVISQGTKYGLYVHEGRRAIVAKPGKVLAVHQRFVSPAVRSRFANRINRKGFIIFGKRVRAMKARPFFRQAVEVSQAKVQQFFAAALKRITTQLSS